MDGHLFFHAPCFDGIASAVLMADFLGRQGWDSISLHTANYHLRDAWLATSLPRPCAIVDFLYHPDATYWADHHQTTFLSEAVREEFSTRRSDLRLVYDAQAGSCAGLLWRHLEAKLGHRTARFEELVRWAEKIDAARYESVDEVFSAATPALQINAGLALSPDANVHCVALVNELRRCTLAEAADRSDVRSLADEAQTRQQQGLEVFRRSARLTGDGIVVFDADDAAGLVNRYSPYYFYRQARYSAGILRLRRGAKITAMRNPWSEFECVHLGKLCEALGGGGHQRVGSIVLSAERCSEASDVLDNLIAGIQAFHAAPPTRGANESEQGHELGQ